MIRRPAHSPLDLRFSRRTLLLGTLAAAGAGVAACTPGSGGKSSSASSAASSPVSTDISGVGKVTLNVWDQNSEGGIAKAQQQLNDAFTAKYPNVTIKRNTQSFTDLKTTLKLALSGNNAPDVVQANQGYPDMGAFVQAGLLQPVDRWAGAYGWKDRIPADLLAINSFSDDGKTWEKGNLYGVSQTGEIVGVYYNKKLLTQAGVAAPKTLDEFRAALATVKAAGLLPIQYGDADKSPGIHLYGLVLSTVAGGKAARDLVTAQGGAWTDPGPVQAATVVADWARKGYLTPGANGIKQDDANAAFGKGHGAFRIDGTWRLAELSDALGNDVGFAVLSGAGGSLETLGGCGLAWSMTSKTKYPDVAAAYINFVTDAGSAKVLEQTGNLPLVPSDAGAGGAGLASEVTASWKAISTSGGLVPYLDYATKTFYDTLTAAVQQLTGGQASPQQFCQTLQADYKTFLAKKG
jgi:raffinose/stachyose/melibiose transport system substrate-binding protein